MYGRNSKEKPDISAKQKALDLLLYRTRTERELYGKLIERGYSPEESAEAVEYVKSYGYVDDEDYAKRYVSARGCTEGKYRIRRSLREKGIDEELIETALEESETDESEAAAELIAKRCGEPHRLEEKEYRRIYGYLVRRGFGGSVISSALKAYQSETE